MKTPLFWQAVRKSGGFITSAEPLLYSTFNYDIARLGETAGLKDTLGGYRVRRGTDNAVDGTDTGFSFCADQLTWTGATTKAVRDKVIRHNPKSNIFQTYVNERVNFDVQAAFFKRP